MIVIDHLRPFFSTTTLPTSDSQRPRTRSKNLTVGHSQGDPEAIVRTAVGNGGLIVGVVGAGGTERVCNHPAKQASRILAKTHSPLLLRVMGTLGASNLKKLLGYTWGHVNHQVVMRNSTVVGIN